jgi:ATP-dependent DNA helicase RecG
VENIALNNCVPPVSVSLETITHDPETVLVATILKGDQRPYRTNRGVYYLRTASGRRLASREELLRLFQATESMFYDESPMVRLGLEDLDLDAVKTFVEETRQAEGLPEIAQERLLRNWRLMAGNNPTIAGIILFGRDPQRHLPFAQINAARIPGTEIANEPSDRKDFTGRVFDVVYQAGPPIPWTRKPCGWASTWSAILTSMRGSPTPVWSPGPAAASRALSSL